MSNIMAVTLNGIAQLEYYRDRELAPQHQLYLDKMDKKMDEGIQVGEQFITEPDLDQRARFVAGNLAHAIFSDNEAMCSALCAWLATRLPELKQVKITRAETGSDGADDGNVAIELVFDEDYQKQVSVQLH